MKTIVAITAGIAAYKSCELVRLLVKQGDDVRVVMTKGAQAFVTPLTLQALSTHEVHTELLDSEAEKGMGHIELAKWAQRIVIAPCTADVLAKLAQGAANDLLSTIMLATKADVFIAPAMNQVMWTNPMVQRNVAILKEYQPDYAWIGPDSGEQACGDVGAGRMVEPNDIVKALVAFNEQPSNALSGQRWLITAGPTNEPIDPVRFIGNKSSGKMGYALANQAAKQGAEVVLISGPSKETADEKLTLIKVQSALEMQKAVMDQLGCIDVFIGAAAVADYRVENVSEQKIKKQNNNDALTLNLVKNPDIIAQVSNSDLRPKTVVGFAAETTKVEEYASKKLKSKKLDWIVANDVSRKDSGFDVDQNTVIMLNKTDRSEIGPENKTEIARKIIAKLIN